MEDYSNFSWAAIQKSMEDLLIEVKKETGASDDEINLALGVCAERFMNTNFMKEPKERV